MSKKRNQKDVTIDYLKKILGDTIEGKLIDDMNLSEIHDYFWRELEEANKIWWKSVEEGNPDYSVYQTHSYLMDTLLCYSKISSKNIYEFINFMEMNKLDYKGMKIHDDLNGCGLTTIDMKKLGFDASYYNESPKQESIMRHVMSLENITDIHNGRRKSDIICSFDTVEHFKNVDEYLDILDSMADIGSYLVINVGTGKGTGHFEEYNVNKLENIPMGYLKKQVDEYLKTKGIALIGVGRHNSPKIYKKISNEPINNYEARMEKEKYTNIRTQYYQKGKEKRSTSIETPQQSKVSFIEKLKNIFRK